MIAVAVSTAGLALLIALGEALHRSGWLTVVASRRLIHAGTGLFSTAVPFIFDSPVPVSVLAAFFVVVNFVGLWQGWFPSMHGTRRWSMGTVAFPLALIFAVWACWMTDPGRLFAIPAIFVILAFSDPLASYVGMRVTERRLSKHDPGQKSLVGSAAFFCSALALGLVVLAWLRTEHAITWTTTEVVLAAIGLAVVTCTAEALSGRGWDNLFIVVAGVVFLAHFDENPGARTLMIAALAAGVAFALMANGLRFLDARGAAAGGLLAATVIGVGGYDWAVPSFTFFFLSSLLSRLGGKRKQRLEYLYEKGSTRDAGQVFANGGIGWAMLLTYVLWPHPALYWAFLGAFAAAAADTWATEVGALSRARPLLVTTLEKVPAGTSGAVSLWGVVGALAGALVVWMAALPYPMADDTGLISWMGGVAVVLGGVAASLVDSLLGATVQVQYVDPVTGAPTERATSESGVHPVLRGRTWIGNDVVNLLCTVCGALIALLGYVLVA